MPKPAEYIRFFGLLASLLIAFAPPVYAQGDAGLTMGSARPASEMTYKDGQGALHTLSADRRGKLTAVHFWAIWCAPCIEELPEVDAAQKEYGPRGFDVIAISLDGSMVKVKDFLKKHGITELTPYLDVDTNAFRAARTPGLPTTLFLDAKGREIARAEGPLDWKSPVVTRFIEDQLK